GLAPRRADGGAGPRELARGLRAREDARAREEEGRDRRDARRERRGALRGPRARPRAREARPPGDAARGDHRGCAAGRLRRRAAPRRDAARRDLLPGAGPAPARRAEGVKPLTALAVSFVVLLVALAAGPFLTRATTLSMNEVFALNAP